jgi:hypothetical protein
MEANNMPGALPAHAHATTTTAVPIDEPLSMAEEAPIDEHGSPGLAPGFNHPSSPEATTSGPVTVGVPDENIDTTMDDIDMPIANFGATPVPEPMDLPLQDDKLPTSRISRFSEIFYESSGKRAFSFMPSMFMVSVSAIMAFIISKLSYRGALAIAERHTPRPRKK